MRIYLTLTAIGMLAFATGCSHKGMPGKVDCVGIMCTMEFRSITVNIKDSSRLPVLLDEWYTTAEDGTKLNMGSASTTGQYLVVDDNIVQGNKNTTKKYIFHGFRGKQEIATGEYVISVDCCHINKVSGPDSITAR